MATRDAVVHVVARDLPMVQHIIGVGTTAVEALGDIKVLVRELDEALTAAEVAAKPDQATEDARKRMRAAIASMKDMSSAEQAQAWRDRQKAAA